MRPLGSILSVILAVTASAAPVTQDRPVFRAGVDVVGVDALVLRNGVPVRGLGPRDFEVRDNDVLQKVDLVSGEELPLNAVLAVDLSASLQGQRLIDLTRAGRALLDGLTARDRAGLVTFGFAVQTDAALTGDWEALRQSLDAAAGRGQTSLIDGCYAGLMLGTSGLGRSLMLVFSDGLDTASWLTAEAVLGAAKRADVVTYGVVAGDAPKSPFLADLTAVTGGQLIAVKSTADLGPTFVALLNEYRQRYLLSYVPTGVDRGGWHVLDVRVIGQGGVSVRARSGYLSSSH